VAGATSSTRCQANHSASLSASSRTYLSRSNRLEAVRTALGGSDLVGSNTYGQIARADGQFGGFHNCTAVVLALPQ